MPWRDLLTWIEAHRDTLAEHAGALAEAAVWVEGGSVLDRHRAATRLGRISFELAAALEALERVHPRDAELDEDTVPIALHEAPAKPVREPSAYREPAGRKRR